MICQFGSDHIKYGFCFGGNACDVDGCNCYEGGIGPCKYEGNSIMSEFGQKCIKGGSACVDAIEKPERTPSENVGPYSYTKP